MYKAIKRHVDFEDEVFRISKVLGVGKQEVRDRVLRKARETTMTIAEAISYVGNQIYVEKMNEEKMNEEKTNEDRSLWVTREQLDIPLCDIFEGTKTNGTVREYVVLCELTLQKEHVILESMTYERMNRYVDNLAQLIEGLEDFDG